MGLVEIAAAYVVEDALVVEKEPGLSFVYSAPDEKAFRKTIAIIVSKEAGCVVEGDEAVKAAVLAVDGAVELTGKDAETAVQMYEVELEFERNGKITRAVKHVLNPPSVGDLFFGHNVVDVRLASKDRWPLTEMLKRTRIGDQTRVRELDEIEHQKRLASLLKD